MIVENDSEFFNEQLNLLENGVIKGYKNTCLNIFLNLTKLIHKSESSKDRDFENLYTGIRYGFKGKSRGAVTFSLNQS